MTGITSLIFWELLLSAYVKEGSSVRICRSLSRIFRLQWGWITCKKNRNCTREHMRHTNTIATVCLEWYKCWKNVWLSFCDLFSELHENLRAQYTPCANTLLAQTHYLIARNARYMLINRFNYCTKWNCILHTINI